MVSVCTVPARGGRLCEHFGGYKTINRIPLYILQFHDMYHHHNQMLPQLGLEHI